MKLKLFAIAAAFITVSLASVGIAAAHDGHNEGSHDQPAGVFIVKKDETINGSYYAAGDRVTIEGTIDGDVYCAAQQVTVTGTIRGDLICAAQNVTVAGDVAGDVRLAAQSVVYDGRIGGSASTFAQTVILGKDALVTRDLNGAAQTVAIDGKIDRDVFMASSELTIKGLVGRNVSGVYEQITVNPLAVVNGDLRYTSDNEAVVADGTVRGATERTALPVEENDSGAETFFGAAVYTFLSLLLISLAVSLIAPQLVHAVSSRGDKQLIQSILVGFFVVFATPFVALLLSITVIGIPLALTLMLVWVLVLVLSGPIFGYFLGRKIMQNRTTNPLLIMLVGASVLLLSYFIPVANIFTVLAAVIIGSGMIALELSRRYNKPQFKVKG